MPVFSPNETLFYDWRNPRKQLKACFYSQNEENKNRRVHRLTVNNNITIILNLCKKNV